MLKKNTKVSWSLSRNSLGVDENETEKMKIDREITKERYISPDKWYISPDKSYWRYKINNN